MQYIEWQANVVLVKKANGVWRMCVDFTDLNKVCPKDNHPLPKIDRLVDSTAGHELLIFMDVDADTTRSQCRKRTGYIRHSLQLKVCTGTR